MSKVNNAHFLLEIFEELSPEGKSMVLAAAIKEREKNNVKKELNKTGKNFHNSSNKRELRDEDIEQEGLNRAYRLLKTVDKLSHVSELDQAASFLLLKNLSGEGVSCVEETMFELVKKVTQIPMKEYIKQEFPTLSYEEVLSRYAELKKEFVKFRQMQNGLM